MKLVLGPNSFHYVDTARYVPADVTQIVCHHGCAYALSIHFAAGWASDKLVHATDGKAFWNQNGDRVWGEWAMFYWRLRYYFAQQPDGSYEVRDRVSMDNATSCVDL